MAKKSTIGEKILTTGCRFSHVHVFDTVKNMQGVDIREITMLFPKSDDMKWLKRAMSKLKKKCYPDDDVMSPIKDGDKPNNKGKTYPENAGHWTVRAWTKEAPGVRDPTNTRDIIDPQEFYSGCYGRATISPFIYDNARGIGYSFFLNNLIKDKDGDKLSSAAGGNAENDFEALASAADNADNFDNSSDLMNEDDDIDF